MKNPLYFLRFSPVLFFAFATISFFCFARQSEAMIISSSAFADGQPIPEKYGHRQENVNPPLAIGEIPSNAKSLVLIVDDPDAPGGTFNHWLVWNIDPTTKEISEGTVPNGATVGRNDFGEEAFGGPQPPSGTHRYFFKLYALDGPLNLPAGANRSQLDDAMKKAKVLASTAWMGTYSAK